MDIDVTKTYNGVLSERALYDVGYPFQSSEDPSILFEKIGQVGEGTYGLV
jgi:CTD kinase subunit alpha